MFPIKTTIRRLVFFLTKPLLYVCIWQKGDELKQSKCLTNQIEKPKAKSLSKIFQPIPLYIIRLHVYIQYMIKKKNEQVIISTSIQIGEQNTKWGIDIKEYLKTTILFEFELCL